MLNAFNARSIFEFGAKDRVRIDSLLAYGDKLLLGLSTGALRVYRVLSPDTPDVSLEHIETIANFSRVKIEILACIKEANILVSLSDSNVHIHDLNDFTLTETLAKARRASTLAVTSNIEHDEETQIPELVSRLAVGIRRRLLLYSWHDGGFQEGKEVTLGGNIRTLTWASGRKVIVGMTSGFVVVDVHTGSVEEVTPPETTNGAAKGKAGDQNGWASYVGMGGWGSRSLSTRLGGDDILLLKDSTTLFVDADGKPLPDKPPIPWSTPPDAIAFSYPYLVSLNAAKHQLEVRNPGTRTLLQKITLPTVNTLHVPPPNVALVHAGKLFYAASPTQVWRMGSTDYETQIQQLVEAEQLDEAINLLETLESVLLNENKDEKLREVQMLKAQRLFEQRKYEESMALFGKVSAPPERVIKLFPRSIAGDLSIWTEDEDEDSGSEAEAEENEEPALEDGAADESENPKPTEETGTGQNGNGGASEPTSPIQKEGNGTPEKISRSPSPELKRSNGTEYGSIRNIAFTRKYGETASIFSFGGRGRADDADSIMGKKETQTIPEAPKPLEGDELKKAAQELAGTFLNDVRRKLTKYFVDGKPVDPLKVLAKTSPHAASRDDPLESSFLTVEPESPGAEEPILPADARIEKVVQTSRVIDTTLFRTYMLIRPTMVGPLVRIQNYCDPEVVSEKLREQGKFEDLVDFLERKQLHREALELLRFFGQADEDSKAPGLRGPQRTVTYLERLKSDYIDLILEFAQWPLKADPKLGMEVFVGDTGNSENLPRLKVLDYLESIDQTLAVQYLEHLISELKDMTPEFHTRLAGLYLTVLARHLPSSENLSWHSRFLHFLTTSSQYRAEKILGWLPRDVPEYFESRAVVLSKMGRHKAALEIYVFKLFDHEKAEAYCTSVHLSSPSTAYETPTADSPATVYHTLLSLYLRPPPPHAAQLQPALAILSRHGARLEAAEALKLVPEDIKMTDLETYFEARIRAANAQVAENRMAAALRKARLVDVQEQLLLGARNQCVIVAEENVCPVCHKRLGQSVIWRLPGGQVVHYGCAKRDGFV
ncbi:vacuolar sorting protein 39 domain 2-domain-containing protein [Geopyxis carbonaria]|nr:vacuolar sorting protein 39 domain 2-domain-containing protein [Geopyxis carbonaria]